LRSTKTGLVGNKSSFVHVNVEVGDGIACGEYIDHGESRDWWRRCSDRAERGVRQDIVLFGSDRGLKDPSELKEKESECFNDDFGDMEPLDREGAHSGLERKHILER
jgi:hypothetical protein